jgi:hypothetical protein
MSPARWTERLISVSALRLCAANQAHPAKDGGCNRELQPASEKHFLPVVAAQPFGRGSEPSAVELDQAGKTFRKRGGTASIDDAAMAYRFGRVAKRSRATDWRKNSPPLLRSFEPNIAPASIDRRGAPRRMARPATDTGPRPSGTRPDRI